MKKKEIILVMTTFLTLLFVYSAFAVSRAEPDKLNFWEDGLITIAMINEESTAGDFNATVPSLFTYISGCMLIGGQEVSCQNVPSGGTASFVIRAPSSGLYNEYDLIQMNATNNASGTETPMAIVRFLKIQDYEIFYTLVEYGRGRGNYFFSSSGEDNLSGSGRSAPGCVYLPNGTEFELNFLHKIFNVKQYYSSATQTAEDVFFHCEYPDKTVVREHLVSDIVKQGGFWKANYSISEIGGSWERMGYLGMHVDDTDYQTGDTILVNCTEINYKFSPEGNVSVSSDGFILEVRNRDPFTVTATTPSTILNGTQEIEIDYTIINNEVYTASDASIEIQAPEFSTFIGTRGELWGASQDKYIFERTEFTPGSSETIRLIARMDMTNAPPIGTLTLSQSIKIRYVPCWEINAYNPTNYIQRLGVGNTTSFDLASTSTINNIQEQINYIYFQINITRDELNATISNIESTVIDIKTTVNYINNTWLPNINETLGNVSSGITAIYNETVCNQYTCSAGTNTAPAGSLCNMLCDANLELDCDSSVSSPGDVCDRLDKVNDTLVNDINVTLSQIIQDIAGINISMTVNLTVDYADVLGNISALYNLTEGGFNAVDGNLSLINETVTETLSLLNCSTAVPETVCDLLHNITSHTEVINMTVWSNFYNLEYLINNTWGNITAQDIINNITSLNTDTQNILTEITKIQEFDEELVFLVTDSFNMQEKAREDVAQGNFDSAIKNLLEANKKLTEASERLTAIDSNAVKQTWRTAISTPLRIIMAIISVTLVISIYHYKRQKSKFQRAM